MPVVTFVTLWLAASTPAVPIPEGDGQPPAPVAEVAPATRNKPKTGQPPASATKKTSPDNDEPGCEE